MMQFDGATGGGHEELTPENVAEGIETTIWLSGRALQLEEMKDSQSIFDDFIDSNLGRPDSYFAKDGSWVVIEKWGEWGEIGFYLTTRDWVQGLQQFADWMREHAWQNRLISIDVNVDYFFGFKCPVDGVSECLALLEDLGLRATLIGGPDPVPPVRDLLQEITTYVETQFGFAIWTLGQRRMLDERRGASVRIQTYGEAHAAAEVSFGLVRSDIDALRRHIFDWEGSPSQPTVAEPGAGPFFVYDRPGQFTFLDDDWGEIKAWLDNWIPKLLSSATDDDFFVQKLQKSPSEESAETLFFNRMLEGTASDDDPWFQSRMAQRDGAAERARAWMAQNPNGTR